MYNNYTARIQIITKVLLVEMLTVVDVSTWSCKRQHLSDRGGEVCAGIFVRVIFLMF